MSTSVQSWLCHREISRGQHDTPIFDVEWVQYGSPPALAVRIVSRSCSKPGEFLVVHASAQVSSGLNNILLCMCRTSFLWYLRLSTFLLQTCAPQFLRLYSMPRIWMSVLTFSTKRRVLSNPLRFPRFAAIATQPNSLDLWPMSKNIVKWYTCSFGLVYPCHSTKHVLSSTQTEATTVAPVSAACLSPAMKTVAQRSCEKRAALQQAMFH